MEPGTFKDRVLVNTDPHLVIEGIILAGYAIKAQKAFYFIRPTYEMDAQLIERELQVAREAGFLGQNILGSDFSFDIAVHRSAGRYICGEATAMVQAIMGKRPHPQKNVHMTDAGLWDRPTIVNNAETLACVPLVIRNGGAWFKSLARTETGAGTKLYCISGKVVRPGCYELPMGIPFREILEEVAGGMLPGSELKAFIPGGASTSFMPPKFLDVAMDIESLKQVGHRFGTGAIMVFRPEDLHPGRHPEPDQLFRPGILRLLHPLPPGPALYPGPAPAPGKRRGRRRFHPQTPGDGRAYGQGLLRLRPRGGGARQGHVAVFRRRSAGTHHSEEVPV